MAAISASESARPSELCDGSEPGRIGICLPLGRERGGELGWGSGTGQKREVLEDLVALEGVRDHRHPALHVPLQHNLGGGDGVALRNRADSGVAQRGVGAGAEGRECDRPHPARNAAFDKRLLLVVPGRDQAHHATLRAGQAAAAQGRAKRGEGCAGKRRSGEGGP